MTTVAVLLFPQSPSCVAKTEQSNLKLVLTARGSGTRCAFYLSHLLHGSVLTIVDDPIDLELHGGLAEL